jgi:hypothetical protein
MGHEILNLKKKKKEEKEEENYQRGINGTEKVQIENDSKEERLSARNKVFAQIFN